MEKLRTFIAIDLTEQIRQKFVEIQSILQKSDADLKWVKPKNAHLTLKFLGSTTTEQIEKIKNILKECSSSTPPFQIGFGGLGVFPNEKYPRVLWIGINQGAESIAELAKQVDDKVSKLGFQKEKRPYSPHLTIGRFRSNKNLESLRFLMQQNLNFQAGEMTADAIHHIQSILSPKGPTYKKIFTSHFHL